MEPFVVTIQVSSQAIEIPFALASFESSINRDRTHSSTCQFGGAQDVVSFIPEEDVSVERIHPEPFGYDGVVICFPVVVPSRQLS